MFEIIEEGSMYYVIGESYRIPVASREAGEKLIEQLESGQESRDSQDNDYANY